MTSSRGLLDRLRFVKDKDKTIDGVMLQAVQSLESVGHEVKWVWSDDVQSDPIDKNVIYVLELFDTSLFHKLSGKTRVIGPMVVLSHLTNNWPFPASRKPVYTMCMHGINVCCTQIGARENRIRILELVELMGGKTSGNFTRHVTHLIAGQVGSTKYKVARSLNTPVLQTSWVEFCWEKGQRESFHATDKDIISSHQCPPLSGCVITSTGFSTEERSRIQSLVTQNGAQYTGQLAKDKCTHLIVGNKNSDKYRYACQWYVLCVTCRWIYKSIETGYCQDEGEYAVESVEEKKQSSEGKFEEKVEDKMVDNVVHDMEGDRIEVEPNVRKRPADPLNNHSKKQRQYDDNDDLDDETLLTQYQNAEMPQLPPINKSGLFSNKTFSINEVVTSQSMKAIASEIKKHGGVIVPSTSSCDYHIASLSRPPNIPSTSCNVVTMIWLEHCLAANTLLDCSAHFLFRPLPVTINSTALEGCVLTISQFEGLEREHLVCLSKKLGATVQDCFARYPSGDLLASTHLVLKKPEGEKYTCAVMWGVPTVTDRWVFTCASTQTIVPVDEYVVSEAPPITNEPNIGMGMDGVSEGEDSLIKTPLRSFHPNFDIESVLHDLPMDHTVTGPNTQLANIFQENIEHALKTVSEAENESEKRREMLKDVVIFVHKKLTTQQRELHRLVKSLGGNWKMGFSSECTHIIFQGKLSEILRDKQLQTAQDNGTNIISPHWLWACSNSGYKEEESLYPCNYNPNKVLPILSQKVTTSPIKEMEMEEDVEEIKGDDMEEMKDNDNEDDSEGEGDEGEELDEADDNKENNEVDKVQSSSSLLRQQIEEIIKTTGMDQVTKQNRRQLQRAPDLKSFKEKEPLSPKRKPKRFNKLRGSPPCDSHVTDSQLMTVTYDDVDCREEQELLAFIRQAASRREEGSGLDKVFVCPETEYDRLHVSPNAQTHDAASEKPHPQTPEMSERKIHRTRSVTRSTTKEHVIDISSTPVAPPIGLPIVTHVKQDTADKLSLYEENQDREKSTKHIQPKILLSSLNVQEKADFGALIQELGGVYLESDHFVPHCTHLVVGKSSRTEKYLAACASGKWVLGKTYMEACRAEKMFVEEGPYEWSPSFQPPGKSGPLDEAPRKWREKIHNNKINGAFEGWKVLLYVESAKQNGLRRLLEAGGATVATPTQAATVVSTGLLTHAFLNITRLPKEPELSLENLVKHNVLCLRPDYIADYLQKETPSDSEQFLLPGALELMQSKVR